MLAGRAPKQSEREKMPAERSESVRDMIRVLEEQEEEEEEARQQARLLPSLPVNHSVGTMTWSLTIRCCRIWCQIGARDILCTYSRESALSD